LSPGGAGSGLRKGEEPHRRKGRKDREEAEAITALRGRILWSLAFREREALEEGEA